LPDGAVLLRSPEAELQLQGLRTALSLALGDRPATVYAAAGASGVLSAAADSEAGRCLVALHEAGIPIIVEEGAAPAGDPNQRAPRANLLDALAAAAFQQTF
jgi:hypothetical protein